VRVPEELPETPDQQRRFDAAGTRRELRLARKRELMRLDQQSKPD
jgi:hypothetical protein